MESTTEPSRCFAYYPNDLDAMMIRNNLFYHQLNIYNDFAMWEQELLFKYCFCAQIDHSNATIDAQTITPCRNIVKPKGNKVLLLNCNDFPNKADKLLETIQSIFDGDMVLVQANKKAESKDGSVSNKRSSFIGVSRNGVNWQALITINKRKTYIGSYESEKDAAVAFDFFSILLHSFTAKVNFSYTRDKVEEMICNYKKNSGCFRPEELHFD